jgi:hypothetical protein
MDGSKFDLHKIPSKKTKRKIKIKAGKDNHSSKETRGGEETSGGEESRKVISSSLLLSSDQGEGTERFSYHVQ